MIVVELGGSHLVELYKKSYYSIKDYSEILGPKIYSALAKHKCVLKIKTHLLNTFVFCQNTFVYSICWACSSVSERNYPKATFRRAFL